MCDIEVPTVGTSTRDKNKSPSPTPLPQLVGNKARVARSGGNKSQGMLHQLFSINMSEMELTTLQRSSQKQLDKLRRIRKPWTVPPD